MNAQDLLDHLRSRSVTVEARDGELLVKAPQGVITPELLAALSAHKPILLQLCAVAVDEVDQPAAKDAAITPEMLPLVELSQPEIDQIVAGVAHGAANVQDIYPLAPLQEGVLFHHLLQTQGDTYLLHSVVGFADRSRLDAFVEALQAVIDRHDILRSAVFWRGLRQPVQVVHRHAVLPLEELTLPGQGEALQELLAATSPRIRRLNLERAPLLAAYAAQDLQTGEWLLALLSHHMVCDHITLDLVLAEIRLLLQGQVSRLPAVLPYRDFIARLRQVSEEEHEAFFRAELGDVSEPTAPFGVVDVQGDGAGVVEVRRDVAASDAQRIREVARQLGVPPAVLFHVAWAQVLARCSASDDVVFGTVLSGRLQGAEVADRVLGMFINTLPVRFRLGELSVREAVGSMFERLTALLAHEQASLALAQRCSAIEPPQPLFTTLFNYRHSQAAGADTSGWEGMRRLHVEERNNYPIALSVDDLGTGFALDIQCTSGIDAQRITDYMARAVARLAEALVQSPQQQLRTLEIVPAEERRQWEQFNATAVASPVEVPVHALFESQVAVQPDAVGVVCEGQTLSYGELNRRANRVAHHLIGLGVRPDDRVALCLERGLSMVVGVLGILKAGGAYVPLDPDYPTERLVYMLSDSAPVAMVTQGAVKGLSTLTVPTVVLEADGSAAALAAQPDGNPTVAGLTAQHLAYVIYTSGSTGQPKGVMVEHRSLHNYLQAAARRYANAQPCSALVSSPLVFDATITSLFTPLVTGGWAQLIPVGNELDTLERLLQTTAAWDLLKVTPAHLSALGERIRTDAIAATVGCFVIGGEALPAATAARWRTLSPRSRLINEYGPTETVVGCTVYEAEDVIPAAGEMPIGRPLDNMRIHLTDRHGVAVPIGVIGEICVGGAGVARGYLNRDELTRERFVPELGGLPGAWMYRTGDKGRLRSDGLLEYLGRDDFQVKLRGYRIELGEIEAQLRQCVGVAGAVVLAREDHPGDRRLVAYVVPTTGVSLAGADLRTKLASCLPEYMIPSAFVTLPELPLTPNGKIDRRALPTLEGNTLALRAFASPIGPIEVAMAEIWQKLLGVPNVGRDDHFFELGGHSLLAVQLISRMRHVLGVDITLRELFSHPTLGEVARAVHVLHGSRLTPIVHVDRTSPVLSWAQQRLWFLDRFDRSTEAAYQIPTLLRLDGELDIGALRATLDRVVARHEVLRTTFANVDGQPVQMIAPPDQGFSLVERDLSELDADVQKTLVAQISAAEHKAPFDLARGPLIRGQLLRLGKERHVLLMTQHHIVSDAWSIGVLVREVSALYAAFAQGAADPLPALPVQYADFAAWQRQRLQGDELQHQLAFWTQHLSGAPALLELPLDNPRPAVQSHLGGSVPLELSAELTARLRRFSQEQGTTLFMTLLAGWSILLSRLSGQQDVVIGTPVANRQRAEIEPLIGFFINTLALRVRLEGDPTVAQLLEQVKATTLEAYAHQDLPFEQVVEALNPPRSLSHSPVFQVALALDNTPGTGALHVPGLSIAPMEPPYRTTNFDMSMFFTDTGVQLSARLEYATELFESDTARRFVGCFQNILVAIIDNPKQRACVVPLLAASERRQLLVEFNDTALPYPQTALLHELFEAQVAMQPDACAVMYESDSLTFDALNRHANRIAHALLRRGVVPNDRVALRVNRSVAMMAGVLGILKAGAAYVPIDPSEPRARAESMIRDSGVQTLLTEADCILDVAPVATMLLGDVTAATVSDEENPTSAVTAQDLAYVIYTSGSTGTPKGVMVTHRSVVNLWAALEDRVFNRLNAKATVGLNASLAFDASVKMWIQLLSGRCMVLIPQELRIDASALLQYLEDRRTEVFDCTPAQLDLLLDAGLLSRDRWQPTGVLIGGDAISVASWRRLQGSTATSFFNLYGPTECTVDATATLVGAEDLVPHIGRPVANASLYILDEQGQPVPIGVAGEIHVGGAGVARGYLGRADLTEERFVPDPFRGADGATRMYRTGDRGRFRKNGTIEFLGRQDFQVKIRGFRIELGEIEAQLSRNDDVREAVVVACDSGADKRLVAYVVPHPNRPLDTKQLRIWLESVLAEHMIPNAFISKTELPLTPNGKVDRRALAVHESGASNVSSDEDAPRGDVELVIAATWSELLGSSDIGRSVSFFDIGGHSLLAVRMMNRLRQIFDIEIPVVAVFRAPTIALLAKVVLTEQVNRFAATDVERVSAEINALSAEEVRMLLAQDE